MSSLFVDQIVRREETECPPIVSPIDPHPTRGDWVNEGVDAYRAVFGDQDYAEFSPHDIPRPMPPNDFARRFGLWNLTTQAKIGFASKALSTGHRATHMQGTGARGTITIVERPEFPEHEFFQAGRRFPCRIRHANASFYDDASSQVRAASLKFADSPSASPLDILMNTGVIQAFWNLSSFMAFVWARLKCKPENWEPQREWLRRWPGAYVGIIESVRVAPSSYAAMLYHTCLAYPFRARDGKSRYAKYRLAPVGLERESGFLNSARQRNPWMQLRDEGCDLSPTYLQQEYRSRLAAGPVRYTLQIQVREFLEERDTWEFFNSARVWDLAESPWLDLAHVSIEEPLPDDETERMQMWLGNQPPSLGLTAAHSTVDYRSMSVARYGVYPWSQRMRRVLRAFGWQRRWPGDL